MSIRILLPLDGSKFAEQAIPFAAELAAQMDASIHVVKVHQPLQDPGLGEAMFMASKLLDDEIRDDDLAYLARTARDERIARFLPTTALIDGAVVAALSNYITNNQIHLVVMTTHGNGGLKRVWFGSVADELMRSVDVPLLLLRPQGAAEGLVPHLRPMRHILLPVDGTEYSERLVETAVRIGGSDHTRYTLLQVLLPAIPVGFGEATAMPVMPTMLEELRRNARTHLERIAESLHKRGYSVDTVVSVNNDVANTIRTFAVENNVDVIAMVTHAPTGWKRIALGSVSEAVLRRTNVPLLVLHPKD